MKQKYIILFFSFFILGWAQQFPKYLYGVASWYGEEFSGKKTASGAIYDPELYTAAHRTLPFGTLIEVENLENGKKVQVTINDRGPFVDNRILDVSQRAARELGFIQKGTAYVKVTILRLGEENYSIPFSNTNMNISLSYPPVNQSFIVTNYVTNTVVVTNYTTTPAPNAIVVPYEDKPITQPKSNPSFILDEPEEIFVPALTQQNQKSFPPRQETKSATPSTNEPQIIFSDILLPEERVIPLETKPISNNSLALSQKNQLKEELRISSFDSLQPGEKYVIQVGSFTRQDNAFRLYQQLRSLGLPAFTSEITISNIRYIRVRVGYYTSRDDAQKVLNRLYNQNLNPLLLKVKP